MSITFAVTYEVITPESAASGDAEDRGYIAHAAKLREAINALFSTRTRWVEGFAAIEPSDSHIPASKWVTVTNGTEYQTAAQEARTLYRPAGVTRASWRRILKLCGVTA